MMTSSINNNNNNNNMNTSTTTSAGAKTLTKPKRPLSAYNLFYRFKRQKILEAHASGNDSKEAIIAILSSLPGLEDYSPSSLVSTLTPAQVSELSKQEIRSALLHNLSPNDTRKRTHRKSHGAMSFLEMNKVMVASWKSVDEDTRSVFEELAEIGRRMYHKRVAEYEEASSTLTYSMTPVVEGSPKKKMRTMASAPPTSAMVKQVEQIRMSTMMPTQQKVEQFAAPSVSPQQPTMIAPLTPPQSSWKSIAIDELAMKQSNILPPFKTFSSNVTLDNSRRVSVAASDIGYDDGSMYCVTAPMKFPETINLRPSDVNVVSSSTTTPVGIVSPISQIDMDFDTLDTTFDLNNNDFDKLFDLEDQDSKSSSGVVDDSASCSSITDDDMSMECDAFELPFSPVTNKMEEAQPDEPTSSGEPSVDDFLKLIAQLDDNLSSYPMALAA